MRDKKTLEDTVEALENEMFAIHVYICDLERSIEEQVDIYAKLEDMLLDVEQELEQL